MSSPFRTSKVNVWNMLVKHANGESKKGLARHYKVSPSSITFQVSRHKDVLLLIVAGSTDKAKTLLFSKKRAKRASLQPKENEKGERLNPGKSYMEYVKAENAKRKVKGQEQIKLGFFEKENWRIAKHLNTDLI